MTNLVGELVGCGPSKQIWNGIDLPEEEEEEEPRKKKKVDLTMIKLMFDS